MKGKKSIMLLSLFGLGLSAMALGKYRPKFFKLTDLDSPATPSFKANFPEKVYQRNSKLTGRPQDYIIGSGLQVHSKVIKMADKAIDKAGVPATVTSGLRTRDWEMYKGRSGQSRHTVGLAIDIDVVNAADRDEIVKALVELGAARIGIGASFVHFDLDHELPVKYWGYAGGNSGVPAPYNPFERFKNLA